MRDRDVRQALRSKLEKEHAAERGTRIIDELGLCQGLARVDMAVINGSLTGYEIKSERDTLRRLDHQIEFYNRALDVVQIVVAESHLEPVMEKVPLWWGVQCARESRHGVVIKEVRPPKRNQGCDPATIVQLLWRHEALQLLRERGVARGLESKPRRVLWKALTEHFTRDEVSEEVRRCLKERLSWRSDQQQGSGDGSSRSFARSSRYRAQPNAGRIGQGSRRPS